LKVLKNDDIRNFLFEFNLSNLSTQEAIKASEIEVLTFLDYRVNLITPYNFIEALLEILCQNKTQLKEQIKILFVISTKIIQCFYFHRDEIYDVLFQTITGLSNTKRDRYNKV